MKKLTDGVLRFQKEIYPQQRKLYAKLAGGQSPRWLLITCSDSRVVPNILAQVGPGELFLCRNAGNIVPAHGNQAGGVSATIEYAVEVLGVKHVIVCGHSDCGAMKAVLHPEKVAHLPAVAHWVGYAARARAVALQSGRHISEKKRLETATNENVLVQLDNLRTLPCVGARLRAGTLGIHGWVYDIRTGGMLVWDETSGRWQPLKEAARLPAATQARRGGRR